MKHFSVLRQAFLYPWHLPCDVYLYGRMMQEYHLYYIGKGVTCLIIIFICIIINLYLKLSLASELS